MATLYAIIFTDSLEEEVLKCSILKPLVWCSYIDDILMMRENGKEELQKFLDALNCYHFTIKFTAEYSRAQINFLNVTFMKAGCQCLHAGLCHVCHCKNQYLSVKPCVLR